MRAFLNTLATGYSDVATQTVQEDYEVQLYEGLSALTEQSYQMMNDYAAAMFIFESVDSVEIIEEGAKDFLNSAKEFFKNLMKKMAEFFKKVYLSIQVQTMTFDKFIEKNKDQMLKSEGFDIKGYEYTLDVNVPNLDPVDDIIHDFNEDIVKLGELSYGKIRELIEEYTEKRTLEKHTAMIVGESKPLIPEDLNEILHRKFRNKADSPGVVKVSKQDIADIANGYKASKKIVEEIKKDEKRINQILNSLFSLFEKGFSVVEKDGESRIKMPGAFKNDPDELINLQPIFSAENTTENTRKLNLYYSFTYMKAKEIVNITSRAAAARTNAYKESLRQQERIARKAIFGKDKKDSKEQLKKED